MSITTGVPAHVPLDLVQDFSFDGAPGIDSDPQRAMDAIRDLRPIVYAPAGRRRRGTWVLKSYDYVAEAYRTPDVFSSRNYSGFSQLIGEDWPLVPIEVDPPMHRLYRTYLNKVFTPSRMTALELEIEETAKVIINDLQNRHGCEFCSEVAQRFPTQIFLRLMGLPLNDSEQLLCWEAALLHGATLPERAAGAQGIKAYLEDALARAERDPKDNVISYVAQAVVNGQACAPIEKLGMAYTLYAAGLDTVASTLSFTFKYLAENPADQERLRKRPELRDRAVEEFVRTMPMVVAGRWVTRDTDFHGVQLKKGDFVSLPTLIANRDPQAFTDATEVDFERRDGLKHIGFGSGPHACMGSHLARRELRIFLNTWFDRIPPFRIEDGETAPTYGGSTFGVKRLPLVW